LAGHPAIVSARNARATDIGPNLVHAAGCRFPDFSEERAASNAGTTHSAFIGGHEPARDQIDLGVGFKAEPRPFSRVGTARPARLAINVDVRGKVIKPAVRNDPRQGQLP